MSLRIRLTAFTALAFILGACDSPDSTAPAETNRSALLVASKWKMTAQTVTPGLDMDGSGALITDVFVFMGACQADDITSYTADGKWSTDNGSAKCDPADPQIDLGTWSMNAAKDSITITTTSDHSVEKYKIDSFTATGFKASSTTIDFGDEEAHVARVAFKAL
ncbi:MAG: hypothetical protein JWP91_4023 [Fibrobacteres bacterium]|nr:hypothetical protein [Fibrobacterota bacterium]